MSNGPIEKFNNSSENTAAAGVRSFKFPLKSFSTVVLFSIVCVCLLICIIPGYFLFSKVSEKGNEAKNEFTKFCKTLTEDYILSKDYISKNSTTLDIDALETLSDYIGSCDEVSSSSSSYSYSSNQDIGESFSLSGNIKNNEQDQIFPFISTLDKEDGEWKVYSIRLQ